MKKLLILIVLLFAGCAMFGVEANLTDGTWSNCTYMSKDGRVVKTLIQVGGQPISWMEPDGTKVDCVPIPKSIAPPE